MKWSLRIGRIAGIDIYVHATFAILLVWLVAVEYLNHQSTRSILSAMAFMLLIFLIIVLHELGHALAARRYGIETERITLWPIGGVASLNRIPEDPKQELVVAFAGPLVNFAISAGIFIGFLVSHTLYSVLDAGNILGQLFWVNIFLAFFNLLPAFPMDGGRVLRALLAMKLSREQATEIAVNVGHVMALIFGTVGLLIINNPFLIFIAFFIWIGADGELQQVRLHSFLRGISVSEVMTRDFQTVRADMPVGELATRLAPGFQTDYPVVEDGRLVGFVNLEDIARGVASGGPQAQVGAYANSNFETAEPGEQVEEVLSEMGPRDTGAVAVLEGGKLVGLVTPANVGEFMMVRSAMRKNARA
ncbi:MAG TPA: site-2 protease family protein [Fimbriimonadaceae bacterium]|nr:site-2 protease family protein [Fimbriimonadaceae bacterium]